MKVVICNRDFFDLSQKAFEILIERGWTVKSCDDDGDSTGVQIREEEHENCDKYYFNYEDSKKIRNHPDIIDVVEELGEEANGRYTKLMIIEIPDDIQWYIEDDEHNEKEWIAEVHRTWNYTDELIK